MPLDLSSLSKKDKTELIELIEDQDARISDLETKIRRGLDETGKPKKTGKTGSEINPFDIGNITNYTTLFGSMKDAVVNIGNILDFNVIQELDRYGTSIQQNFGLSRDRIFEFKTAIADTVPELIKYGYEESEAVQVTADIMDGLRTSAILTSEATLKIGAAAKISGEDVQPLVEGFRGVGISMESVGDEMKSVVDYARNVGVSVKTVSSGVIDNIGKLNLYNFDNGVTGLAKMAAQSSRFGIEMRDTFRIAEELFSPENAINLAASLQRLGVTANGLLDPLRAMDLAQNDPEQLQKEILNLSKEFTTFNEKTGKMEILPGAKRRLREIAGELKIDAGEFAKMSIQAADFDRKLSQIRMPALSEGDEETKELIASLAQLDASGVATITVKDAETGMMKTKEVDQLTSEDITNLRKANDESSLKIEEIAIKQLDETKQTNTILLSGELAGKFARATAPTFDKFGTTVAGIYKGVAQGYRDQLGTTQSIREKFEGVAGSAEKFMVGTLTEDTDLIAEGYLEFKNGAKEVVDSFLNASTAFVETVFNNAVEKIQKSYSPDNYKPANTETTVNVQGTILLKGEGNQNGFTTMDAANFFSDPNNVIMTQNKLEMVNAPSSVNGGKNK